MKPTLSLALIARNEARCITRCLASIRNVADELLVVDTGSTDDTPRLAREAGARVETFTWCDDFAAARNHALDLARGDWILVLDADEHASPELAAALPEFIRTRPGTVGRLGIVSEFQRRGQSLRSRTRVSRLFPRGARFEGRIHEQLVSPLPRADVPGDLWHDGYLLTTKSERNLGLLRRELAASPGNPYLLFQLALEHTALEQVEPAAAALREAFRKLTGHEAFAPNVAVDLLYALTELRAFDEGLDILARASELCREFPDFHLAAGLFIMQLVRSDPARHSARLPEIERHFLRCLEIGETDRHKSVAGAGSFLARYNLGLLYHVFGEDAAARSCFERAAAEGHAPSRQMLATLPDPAAPPPKRP